MLVRRQRVAARLKPCPDATDATAIEKIPTIRKTLSGWGTYKGKGETTSLTAVSPKRATLPASGEAGSGEGWRVGALGARATQGSPLRKRKTWTRQQAGKASTTGPADSSRSSSE